MSSVSRLAALTARVLNTLDEAMLCAEPRVGAAGTIGACRSVEFALASLDDDLDDEAHATLSSQAYVAESTHPNATVVALCNVEVRHDAGRGVLSVHWIPILV